MILSCLGPKSLVRFVSSCKTLLNDNRMLPEEVSRRKACVAWGKEQLLILHQRTMVFPAPRADVLLAFQVYSLCRRIIDDKIDYLVDAPENFRDELFAHERSELAVPTGPPHSHPNFYMLPLAFYIRPHGDLQWPIHASATFTDARSLIDRILQRYSQQMDSFYSWLHSSSETKGYNHSNYPFRKFDHPLCTTYLEESLLYVRDRIVVDQELNDAFRILAFTAAIRYPYIRDSLHFVLHHSDALAFNTILQQPTFVSLESSQLVYKFNRFQEWNVVPSPSATSIASAAV